jgi:hypothetical protein
MISKFIAGRRSRAYVNCAPFLACAALAMPQSSRAQVAVYIEGTASDLQQGPGGNYLYGGTLGMLYDGPRVFKVAVLSADIQARYVTNSGERLIGTTVGPRVSFPNKKLRLTPYGEFMVGFARYRDSSAAGALNTTDNQWQANAGALRRLNSRLDLMVDYDYSQYGAEGGKYNPKNFNAGIAFHFVRQ